jgi:tetratricopeptide (TPR) repeat protein
MQLANMIGKRSGDHGGLRFALQQIGIRLRVLEPRGKHPVSAAIRTAQVGRWTTACKFAVSLVAVALLAVSGLRAQSQVGDEWQTVFRQGTQAFSEGDLSTAAQSFRRVTQMEPQFAEGHFNLGLVLLRQGDTPGAGREFRAALKLKPGLRGGNLFLGITLYASNQFGAAKLAFEREVAGDPKDAAAMEWLGRTEIALNEPSKAADILDKAVVLDSHNIDTLYFCGRAHMLASKEAYDKMYNADPNSWRVHEVLAQSYSDSDHYQQAITEYLAAIKLAPQEPELHEWLGDEYLATSNTSEAMKAYSAELAVAPTNYRAMYSLGVVQVETNNAKDGVESLRKALAGDASLIRAYYYLGWGEQKLGNYDVALKYLNKAVEAHPSDYLVQRAYYQLSVVYRALNRPADSRAALAQYSALKRKSERHMNAQPSALTKEDSDAVSDDRSQAPVPQSAHDSNPP